jgi:hypothetical protein
LEICWRKCTHVPWRPLSTGERKVYAHLAHSAHCRPLPPIAAHCTRCALCPLCALLPVMRLWRALAGPLPATRYQIPRRFLFVCLFRFTPRGWVAEWRYRHALHHSSHQAHQESQNAQDLDPPAASRSFLGSTSLPNSWTQPTISWREVTGRVGS